MDDCVFTTVTRAAAASLVGALCAGAVGCGTPRDARPEARMRLADIRLDRESERFAAEVPRNGTLQSILAAHRMRPDHGAAFLDAVTRVFDLRGLKAHHPYQIELTFDGFVREFRYQIDADRFLHVLGTPRTHVQTADATAGTPTLTPTGATADAAPPADFKVEIVPYRKERALVSVRGRIDKEHPSLIAAVNAAGENITLAIALAEIFGGDIDFAHDLQPGDEFELVFEQVMREGARAGYGDILGASFTNSGKTYSAFQYTVPGGKPAYYDEQGRSLHRFFLASPLKFEPRVTSAFSYRRLHPVLGIARPHLGVDFGAPAGAPVVSVADATVVSAQFTKGGGNTVTLRHTGGYETQYLHLSSFAKGLHAGMRVSQGEVIGKVGSTGLATGPHLHYVLKKNGEHVNPLAEHKRHPPGEPIPPSLLTAFDTSRDLSRARFVSASAARVESTVAANAAANASTAAAAAGAASAATAAGSTNATSSAAARTSASGASTSSPQPSQAQ
jgi:murein DD-endopeptidase MepM/ murein hydrolase activator NlpD